MDHQVGVVLSKLSALGLDQSTVVGMETSVVHALTSISEWLID